MPGQVCTMSADTTFIAKCADSTVKEIKVGKKSNTETPSHCDSCGAHTRNQSLPPNGGLIGIPCEIVGVVIDIGDAKPVIHTIVPLQIVQHRPCKNTPDVDALVLGLCNL